MHRHDLRVDPDEAQEVVRLAAERHSSSPEEGPTVAGLAEALGLPADEVDRLLTEVRKRRGVAPEAKRSFGDRSAAISAAIVLGLVVVVGAFWFGLRIVRGFGSPTVTSPTEMKVDLSNGAGTVVQAPNGVTLRYRGLTGDAVGEPFESLTAEQRAKQDELRNLSKEWAQKRALKSDAEIDAAIQDLKEKIAASDREIATAPTPPATP